MPFTPEDLKWMPIAFEHPGQVSVFTSPCSSTFWMGATIPLDGRRFQLAGKVILQNGRELFANLRLSTDRPVVLEPNEVFCAVGDTWFNPDEPGFCDALGLKREQTLPYTWLPDRPLDHPVPGPYPVEWDATVGRDSQRPSNSRPWWRFW
jgi:hypothetical protein